MIEGSEAVAFAVEEIQRRGDAGDAYHLASESLELAVADGVLEKQQAEQSGGIGIRLFHDTRVGFSYTSTLTRASIREAVDKAIFLAGQLPPDPHTVLAERPDRSYPPLVTEDPDYDSVTLAEKIEITHAIERSARSLDPRVTKFQQSAFQEVRTSITIASTNGIQGSYRSTRAYGSCECAAVEGTDSQVGWGSGWAKSAARLDPVTIGNEAATRAVRKLNAKAWTTQATNLVLDPWAASGIIAALAEAFRADHVLRGKSLLVGKMGDEIASGHVTLVDDGAMEDGSASALFDDEGWPTERTVLIERGELKSLIHNASSARRMNAPQTGNAAREGFMTPPKIGASNFFILPGKYSPEDLYRIADDGLVMTETMGLHTIDSVTGEFSLAANGLRIVNGQVQEAINGIAIAGNLIDLLKRIVALGSDLRTFAGGGVACSTLVEGISVAGQ